MNNNQELNEFEAAIVFGFSPDLLRWFTEYPVIDDNLLPFRKENDLYYFDLDSLMEFNKKLEGKWPLPPKGNRPTMPAGIRREIKQEAQYQCPVCHKNQGEAAHIHAVAKSFCNHPKNLLFLCPNHHTEYDFGVRSANISIEEVLQFKKSLQTYNKIHWKLKGKIIHTYIGALNTAVSLIDVQKRLEKVIPDKDFRKILDTISKASVESGGKEIKDSSSRSLRQEIKDNANAESATTCPLCNGVGNTNLYDPCPVCFGNGEIEDAEIRTIDISRYEAVDCELCSGTGKHNGGSCPVCGGEGQVSKGFAEEHDWSQYDFIDCELCNGTGRHDSEVCPACGGERQVPKGFAEAHDWSQYDLVDCELCNGTGRHDSDVCPACGGERQVPKGFAEAHDWSQYDLVDCKLCNGTGKHDRDICPACGGEEQVPKGVAEEHDWSQYD